MYNLKLKAFTLLEVLVAGGVLFIVTSAVVGLSNSIIQGTGRNADRTVTNRWAIEGLELTSKVRNDSLKAGGTLISGEKIWFEPASSVTTYGWYELKTDPNNSSKWILDFMNPNVHVALRLIPSIFPNLAPLTSQGLVAHRLICVEAYNAVDQSNSDDYINCDSENEAGTVKAKDGDRRNVTDCQTDLYCLVSKSSLNVNNPDGGRLIPPGNAVKVRSIIVWQDRTTFQTSEVGTVFTNWKRLEQN